MSGRLDPHWRKNGGQSIIETVVGIIVLIPIVLFLFDVAVLVLSNSANDNLAKSCARAAASATNNLGIGAGDKAQEAAQNIANNFQQSTIIQAAGSIGSFLDGIAWVPDNAAPPAPQLNAVRSGTAINPDPLPGQVAVMTRMQVTVPVAFPGIGNQWTFVAKAVEPIVSLPPQ